MDKRTYKSQPTVTGTALAHLLWKSTLKPGVDSAIDATCGNGHDSLAIAKILFGKRNNEENRDDNGFGEYLDVERDDSELLCIDIQDCAIERTRKLLTNEQYYGSNNFDGNQVKVEKCSHSPLPAHLLKSKTSVGLVVYNLGWLPGTGSSNTIGEEKLSTQVDTTLQSIADAALLLRVGGLLSIMTYPGTCEREASAVHGFAESLAMFTTRNPGGWEEVLGSLDVSIRNDVRQAASYVYNEGMKGQAWRVFDHKPLGRHSSPILVTLSRIK